MTGLEIIFAILGLIAVGSGLLVVTTQHVVHAALWLIVTLGAVAGCFLVLSAEFVAFVQLLIYVGAIVVLVLFALMLTRAPTGPTPEVTGRNRWVAMVVAVATAALLLATLQAGYSGAEIDFDAVEVGSGSAIGSALFSNWVLPFEVLSVLLLAALVGAIVLSRGRPQRGDTGEGDHR